MSVYFGSAKTLFTLMFLAFSASYISDYFEGALMTNYESIPIELSRDLLPSIAICVPYNGLFFDLRDFTSDEKIDILPNSTDIPARVTIRSQMDEILNTKIKNWLRQDTTKAGQCFRAKVPGGTNRLIIQLKTPKRYKPYLKNITGSTDMKFKIFLYNPQNFLDANEAAFITVSTASHKTYTADIQNVLLHPNMADIYQQCERVPQNGTVYDFCWTDFKNAYVLKTYNCYLLSDNNKDKGDYPLCGLREQSQHTIVAHRVQREVKSCKHICSFYHISYTDVTSRNEDIASPRVRLHFPDFLIRIESSRKVGFTDVVGNVGGNLGLWLGYSLLDIINMKDWILNRGQKS